MRIAVLGAVLLLAACGQPLQTSASNPPTSMQSQGTILTNHPPESANSLPPGASVLAPLTSIVGQLNTTVVGPAVR